MAHPAEIGSTASQYQILAKLAVGGMAEIFLARGATVAGVERHCVLKRVLREHAGNAELVGMFLDEARLAAQLHHPNIAAVYDVGVLGDSYFFTMEYIHGETIRSMLERATDLSRPLPLACTLTIAAAAAAGLRHAHERKSPGGRLLEIVHRDISPSNLMVSFEGNVKIVDFGVAKSADRPVRTQTGTVRGTVSYMSPEQCQARPVDRRSDLFSLGIVMWEMLTGERLYRRPSDFESVMAIVNEPAPPPSSRRPEIPRAIDDIVLRLLAKPVTERFQTATALIEAIEDASQRVGLTLSTQTVSRVMHDLFGSRSEPWLELEDTTVMDEPVTFTTRSQLLDLEAASVDAAGSPIDAAHAGVEIARPAVATPPRADAPTALLHARPAGGTAQPVATRARRISTRWIVAGSLLGLAMAVAAWRVLATSDGGSAGASPSSVPAASSMTDASVSSPIAAAHGPIDAEPPAAVDRSAAPGPPSPAPAPDAGRSSPPKPAHAPGSRATRATRATDPRPARETAEELRVQSIHQLSDRRAYDDVVRACSAGAVTTAIASICVLAACHERDGARAQRWLSRNPAHLRETLITQCQRLGNEDIHDDSDIPRRR